MSINYLYIHIYDYFLFTWDNRKYTDITRSQIYCHQTNNHIQILIWKETEVNIIYLHITARLLVPSVEENWNLEEKITEISTKNVPNHTSLFIGCSLPYWSGKLRRQFLQKWVGEWDLLNTLCGSISCDSYTCCCHLKSHGFIPAYPVALFVSMFHQLDFRGVPSLRSCLCSWSHTTRCLLTYPTLHLGTFTENATDIRCTLLHISFPDLFLVCCPCLSPCWLSHWPLDLKIALLH